MLFEIYFLDLVVQLLAMEKNFPGAPLPSSGEGLGERVSTLLGGEGFDTLVGEGLNSSGFVNPKERKFNNTNINNLQSI